MQKLDFPSQHVLQGIDAKVTNYKIAGQKLNAAKVLCVVNGKLILVK